MIDQLKYYYKAINTDWVRYTFYILVVIVALLLLYHIFFQNSCAKLDAGRIYKAKEATEGVAIDKRYFYAIGHDKVGKYSRKSGKRVIAKKLPFKHIKGGKIVNDDLVIINTPPGRPEQNALIWLDVETLEMIDMMTLPHIQGEITWIDWAWEKWWICDAQYKKNVKETTIYCFNPDWVLEGFWKLPKDVVRSIEPKSLSGGAWFGEMLCVSGYEKPELYVLDLPEKKIHAKLLRLLLVCFDGQGFTFERGKESVYAWGTRRDKGLVVRCAIDLE